MGFWGQGPQQGQGQSPWSGIRNLLVVEYPNKASTLLLCRVFWTPIPYIPHIQLSYLLFVKLLHSFNGLFSRTTWVSRHQKSRTILVKPIWIYWTRDSEWQWHQLGHMQICTSPESDNHASTPQARCPCCRPTNSIQALKVVCYSWKLLRIHSPRSTTLYW